MMVTHHIVRDGLFLQLLVRNVLSSYDKTISIPIPHRMQLVNINDYNVPIVDRRFVHINVRCCESLYLTFQSGGNITSSKNVVLHILSDGIIIKNCLNISDKACSTTPAKVVAKNVFGCFIPFLLRADWNHDGWIRLSLGEKMNAKGRELISNGGGPEVDELFSYQAGKDFPICYIAVGSLTPAKLRVSVTFATVLPQNSTNSLHLDVPETTKIGSVLHNLTEFKHDEAVSISSTSWDPGMIDINGRHLILAKELNYEKKRTFYFQMTDNFPKVFSQRQPVLLEEMPIGTCLENWLRITDLDIHDRHKQKLLNNSFLRMNDTTGEISLIRRVDRDGPDGVRFIPMLQEVLDPMGTLFTNHNITILDANDNYPLFEEGLYRMSMPFSVNATDDQILEFNIRDLDEDQKPGFDLSIEDGNNITVFYLKGKTLYAYMDELMNIETLRSRDWTYLLTVKATDRPKRGRPLSSYTVVFLIIEPPADLQKSRVTTPHIKFHRLPKIEVLESTSIGTNLKTLNLSSAGLHYQYSMYSSRSVCKNGKQGSDYFGIDQYSGVLMVGTKLDADEETGGCSLLELVINITDVQTCTTQPFVKVVIAITNVNDIPPKFNQSLTKVVLPCNLDLEGNFSLAALSVSAMKSPINVSLQFDARNHYRYSLKYDRYVWLLKMNTTRNQLVDKRDADIVKIIAVDSGEPQLTSTAVVVIRQDCVSSFPERTTAKTVEKDLTHLSSPSSSIKTKTFKHDPVALSSTDSSSKDKIVELSSSPSSFKGKIIEDDHVTLSSGPSRSVMNAVKDDAVARSTQPIVCSTYRVDPKTSKTHHLLHLVTSTRIWFDVSTLKEDIYMYPDNLSLKKKPSTRTPDSYHIRTNSHVQSSNNHDMEHGTVGEITTFPCCKCQDDKADSDVAGNTGANGGDSTGYIVLLAILLLVLLILAAILYRKHRKKKEITHPEDLCI